MYTYSSSHNHGSGKWMPRLVSYKLGDIDIIMCFNFHDYGRKATPHWTLTAGSPEKISSWSFRRFRSWRFAHFQLPSGGQNSVSGSSLLQVVILSLFPLFLSKIFTSKLVKMMKPFSPNTFFFPHFWVEDVGPNITYPGFAGSPGDGWLLESSLSSHGAVWEMVVNRMTQWKMWDWLFLLRIFFRASIWSVNWEVSVSWEVLEQI